MSKKNEALRGALTIINMLPIPSDLGHDARQGIKARVAAIEAAIQADDQPAVVGVWYDLLSRHLQALRDGGWGCERQARLFNMVMLLEAEYTDELGSVLAKQP